MYRKISGLPLILSGFFFALCLMAGGSVSGHPLLSSDPANQSWHAPDQSDEIVFTGKDDQKKAELVLKKEALAKGAVQLKIETDAQKS